MAPGADQSQSSTSHVYEVCVRGELSDALIRELGATRRSPRTTVVVPTVDRAALHSTIRRLEDLGLELLSIHEVAEPEGPAANVPEDGG